MAENDRRKVTVLVVEDEPLIRMFASDIVSDAGLDVLEAGDAHEALEILESHPEVSVLFTDIAMPGKIDGLDLAHATRERWPHIGLLLASGHRHLADTELPPGSVFASKPYSVNEIVSVLRRLSSGSEADDR